MVSLLRWDLRDLVTLGIWLGLTARITTSAVAASAGSVVVRTPWVFSRYSRRAGSSSLTVICWGSTTLPRIRPPIMPSPWGRRRKIRSSSFECPPCHIWFPPAPALLRRGRKRLLHIGICLADVSVDAADGFLQVVVGVGEHQAEVSLAIAPKAVPGTQMTRAPRISSSANS